MFTTDEFELLLEALDALESKSSSDMLTSMMLGIAFAEDKEEFMERAEKDRERVMREAVPTRERIILMKAKLIQVRDRLMINDLDTEII